MSEDKTIVNQALRRMAFADAHPHVHLLERRYPQPHAEAVWRDAADNQAIVIRPDMGLLLDTLESMTWE